MSNQIKINHVEPVTRNIQRTDKREWGTTKHIIKMKEMQRIEERLEFNKEGELTEVWIQFSDETSRKPSQKNPEDVITYRDEITFSWQSGNRFGNGGEPHERTGWSTGWQDDLEGKMKEAEVRNKALKYFAKRKEQLLGKEA